jgi:hypothetical protein
MGIEYTLLQDEKIITREVAFGFRFECHILTAIKKKIIEQYPTHNKIMKRTSGVLHSRQRKDTMTCINRQASVVLSLSFLSFPMIFTYYL